MPTIKIKDTPYPFNYYSSATPIDYEGVGTDHSVNSTIGPIDRDLANSEVEKNEIIRRFDLGGLWKATGKKHSQGGTPTLLNPGDFVYSDDPTLSFSKEENEMFEFKDGGSKRKNTPAQMVRRMVEPKDYNKYVKILQDANKDKIAKDTASLMKEKNDEILGQIEYLQEAKKQFPQGLSEIAQTSAPIYADEVKTEVQQQDQFQYGGTRLPQYQGGGSKEQSTLKYITDMFGLTDELKDIYCPSCTPQQKAEIKKKILKESKLPPVTVLGQKRPTISRPGEPMEWPKTKVPQPLPPPGIKPTPYTLPPGVPTKTSTTAQIEETESIKPYEPRVPLSPLQKANLAYSFGQALDINKYMPMRSQIKSPLVELNKFNVNPALNQLNTQTQQAFSATQALNPVLAMAQQQAIQGQALNKSDELLGNYNNQNIAIANQQNLTNQQIQAADLRANIGFNQDYYDKVQAANQAFDNEKRFALNQGVSLANQYISENQAFEQALAQQKTYGTRRNPVTGKLEAAPLYDVDLSGFRPRVYSTGVNVDPRTLGTSQGSQYNDLLQGAQQALQSAMASGSSVDFKNYAQALKNLQVLSKLGTYKKGGTIQRMRKK